MPVRSDGGILSKPVLAICLSVNASGFPLSPR